MALSSFYGQFFIKLQERISAMVPEIRYCDQDLGQLEHYEDRPAVSFPCLLIDFTSTPYDQLLNQVQMGTPVLQLRIGFPPFSPSNSLAPTPVREKALNYYELEHRIYQALQNWDADGICQPLTRITDGTEKREDAIRVRVMLFNTSFEDDSASPVYQKVERPALDISFD